MSYAQFSATHTSFFQDDLNKLQCLINFSCNGVSIKVKTEKAVGAGNRNRN